MGKQRPILADVMAAVGIAALYKAHVQPWIYTWGAREDEITATLPGDDLVDPDTPRTTRAVSIAATRDDVWPWLAQIGEDRGGFYSYSVLERAVGADVHNAAVIHPEWQELQVGDTIWLARRYGPGARQIVADVKPRSHLVLVSPADFERLQRGEKASGCWSFVLRPEVGRTRLIVRGSGGAVGHSWFDIPHFVMEQKMMRGIAQRTQRTRRLSRPSPGYRWDDGRILVRDDRPLAPAP
ncbi:MULTISPECIES: hypothetical protein [Mycobacteriaceae]|uniref:Uncharacterized protein n=1 Tax=Mycolicibacterium novocastrense TaxID=59813 RepID=A0ABQ0KSV5_MYCNV|nr:hypothetical protein [Mycolicibacterium novocastrense]GAT12547.1 uncharacterized protein RMCN_5680 [Mycolicibacterium novocastrense]